MNFLLYLKLAAILLTDVINLLMIASFEDASYIEKNSGQSWKVIHNILLVHNLFVAKLMGGIAWILQKDGFVFKWEMMLAKLCK